MSFHNNPGPIARGRPRRYRGRPTAGTLLVAFAALCGSGVTWAQEAAVRGGGKGAEAAAPHDDSAPAPGHWELPRLFYEPRERRGLDAQDRALRSGLKGTPAPSAGPRFDGWLAGPTGTHAWVSGTRYVADPAGRLRRAQENDGEAAALDIDATAQLRVGESDYGAAAAPEAIDAARRTAATEPR
jgi:hypothetical protein